VAHDGGAPLLHQVGQLGLLAVVGHPARGTQSGERSLHAQQCKARRRLLDSACAVRLQ
jgi:hypothetical protein